MRFRLPMDCAGVVHGGVTLEIGGDRTVEVEEWAASALAAHGLRPAGEPEPVADEKAGDGRQRSRAGRRGGGA